jgi:hypothetical protein
VGGKHGLWVLILLRDLVVKVFHCMIGVSNCGTYCHFILKLSLSHKPWLPDYYTATLFAKGYVELPKGLEMSRLLIVNMKLIANIKWIFFYSMTSSVAHWST